MANVPKIVGAGNGPSKKIKRKSPGKMEPMPYYPETGSNRKSGPNEIAKEDFKNAIIKIWEDRNLKNIGTKLNP